MTYTVVPVTSGNLQQSITQPPDCCSAIRTGLATILVAFTIVVIGSTQGLAQERGAAGAAEEPMLELSALTFLSSIPSLFYQDQSGEFRAFPVGHASRGQPIQLPITPNLVLYREVENEAGEQVKEPSLTIPLTPGLEKAFLVFYRTRDGRFNYRLASDDTETHPAGTARILNLLDTPIACRLGDQVLQLGPGEDLSQIRVPVNDRFAFAFALLTADGAVRTGPNTPLRMRNPNQRFLSIVTVTERPNYDENGNLINIDYFPNATYLFDRVR